MERRIRRNRKFSLKYRFEKWFFEDSLKDAKRLFIYLFEGFIFVALLAMLFLFPALFH